jgi:hypothetical protein
MTPGPSQLLHLLPGDFALGAAGQPSHGNQFCFVRLQMAGLESWQDKGKAIPNHQSIHVAPPGAKIQNWYNPVLGVLKAAELLIDTMHHHPAVFCSWPAHSSFTEW